MQVIRIVIATLLFLVLSEGLSYARSAIRKSGSIVAEIDGRYLRQRGSIVAEFDGKYVRKSGSIVLEFDGRYVRKSGSIVAEIDGRYIRRSGSIVWEIDQNGTVRQHGSIAYTVDDYSDSDKLQVVAFLLLFAD